MEESEDFPLPQVKSALDQYIKSRQEALRIRRILTIFLFSFLGSPEASNDQQPFALAAPEASITIKRLPAGTSGLRQGYLRALQANERAKKDYNFFLDARQPSDEGSNRPISKKTRDDEEEPQEQDEPLQTYLSLLRLRRRYEKLRILHDYLDVLSQMPPARPHFVDMSEMLEKLPPPPQPPADILQESGTGNMDVFASSTSRLMRQLEISVLRTKHALDEEKNMLAEWKRKKDSEGLRSNLSESCKLQALGRTRNELISWIESELSKAGRQMDGDDEQIAIIGDSNVSLNSASSAEGIKHQYQEYVGARKSLLSHLSTATVSLPIQERSTIACNSDEVGQNAVTDHLAPAYSILPYLSDHLLPLLTYQKSVIQQKSSITTGLAKQQRSMIQALERLSEESHLLPTYPLLVGQSRFRHAAAVLATRALENRPPSEREISGSGGEDCIKKARAWAFAADTARATTEDAVREKIESGKRRIRMAQVTLDELQDIFGSNKLANQPDAIENVNRRDDTDIWATLAAPNLKRRKDKDQQKAHYSKARERAEGQGLWRGLDGETGVLSGGS